MSKSKNERLLLDQRDRELYNLPTDETEQHQPGQMEGVHGYLPYVDNYMMVQAPTYWDPSVAQVAYIPYPPVTYYQPYDYPVVAASHPAPVSKTPRNKPSAPLPAAPKGRAPPDSNIVYPSPVVPTSFQTAVVTAVPVQYSYTPPFQPAVAPAVPVQYSYPPPFQPAVAPAVPVQYSYPPPLQPAVAPAVPVQYSYPPPLQPAVAPAVPVQYSYPPPALPPPPTYYHHRSSSPPYHHYPRHPPSPYYHYRRRPPSPHYYRDRHSLPPISHRETHRERDHHERHSDDVPLIMSYFGRRRDVTRRPNRWYH